MKLFSESEKIWQHVPMRGPLYCKTLWLAMQYFWVQYRKTFFRGLSGVIDNLTRKFSWWKIVEKFNITQVHTSLRLAVKNFPETILKIASRTSLNLGLISQWEYVFLNFWRFGDFNSFYVLYDSIFLPCAELKLIVFQTNVSLVIDSFLFAFVQARSIYPHNWR